MLDFDSLPIQLYNHQKEGVKRTLQHPNKSHILAFQVGTGKTYTALSIAKFLEDKCIPTKIIIPPSLRTNWEREISKVGNYDVELYSWTKMPKSFDGRYFLITDESHLYSNINSSRCNNYLNLALPDNYMDVYGVLCLTGTPLPNGQPKNLYPLLKSIRHPVAANKDYYEKRYCNAHLVDFISPNTGKRVKYWDNTGSSNLKELWERTKDSIYYVRQSDCLDLPEHNRIFKEIDFSKEEQKIYKEKLDVLKADYYARLDAGDIKSGAEHMVFLGYARKIGCELKIPYTEELINQILSEKNKPIVFCSFLEPLETLSKKYNADIISGKITDKQKLVDKFNNSEKNVLFIQTQTAVGFNIQAGNYGIFIDRTYSPKDYEQAEGRYNRHGQLNKTTSIWLQNGIDIYIDEILLKKTERINLVLTGKRKTLSGIKSVEDIAPDLLREIFNY